MKSDAGSVPAYLASLPADRRAAIEAVRSVVRENLAPGYEEGMQYGMIGWCVPHSIYPAGYHCDPRQPLPFASLASQKNHMALYLFCIYGSAADDRWFREAWAKSGKKLDMGKSCIRFKKLDDLALDVIAGAIRRMPVESFIASYEAAIGANAARRQVATKAPGKTPMKASATKKIAKKRVAAGRPAKKATAKKKVAARKTGRARE